MKRTTGLAISAFFIFGCGIFADACTTTYVRVPAVCPRDPLCLDDRPDGGADARGREADFIRRHRSSTVVVRGTRYRPNAEPASSSGIGTLVGAKGYVLTALHLIDGADRITVALRDGGAHEMPAIPLAASRDEDVVLLVLPEGERLPPSLPVRYGPVIKGDDVRFVGSGTAVRRGEVRDADINAGINRSFADAAVAAALPDAGAPVLNVCGEVVGVALGPFGRRGMLRFVPIDRALAVLSVTPADLR